MARRGRRKQPQLLSLVLIIAVVGIFLYFFNQEQNAVIPTTSPIESSEKLEIYFLDVGQADSILVFQGIHGLLIDAGGNKSAGELVEILESRGLKKNPTENDKRLEVVIGTHPHEDHIGGLDAVINNFPIDKLIMPKAEATTKTFEDVLDAIDNAGLKVTAPKLGDKYQIGSATLEILYDLVDEKELNNCSTVSKLSFGSRSVLFTGDAEKDVEEHLLDTGVDVKSDFLKVGHHGSSSSTTKKFLAEVNPIAAFISCGVDNTYNHPHRETMESLTEAGVTIYRTDISGTQLLTINGDGTYNVVNDK